MLKGYTKSTFVLNSAASSPKQDTTIGTNHIPSASAAAWDAVGHARAFVCSCDSTLGGREGCAACGAPSLAAQGNGGLCGHGAARRRRSALPNQLCLGVLRMRGVERNLPKGSPSRGRRLPRTWPKRSQSSSSIRGVRAKPEVPQQHGA